MNIGIDIRCLTGPVKTGVQEYTHAMLSALFTTDTGHKFFLYNNSSHPNNLPRPWDYPFVKYINTTIPNKVFNVRQSVFHKPFLDEIIKSQANIEALPYFFSPNLNFTSLSPQTKHILTIHDWSFRFFPECFTVKQKLWHSWLRPERQCQKAHKIICLSETTKQDTVRHCQIDSNKVEIIHPGQTLQKPDPATLRRDVSIIRRKYNLPEHYLLFLGTIEPRKNLVALIQGFKLAVPKLNYPVSLVIAGASGWKNSEIYKQIASSSYKEKIQIVGYVNETEKPALYAAADAFIYPSLYEGFGLPLLEAMTMGRPIITSSRAPMSTLTQSTAALVNPLNPSDIAEKIVTVFNSPETANHLAKHGEILARQYSWKKASEQWLKIIT